MDGLVVYSKFKSAGCTTGHCRFYEKYETAEKFFNSLNRRSAQLYSRVPIYETNGWILVKERGGNMK